MKGKDKGVFVAIALMTGCMTLYAVLASSRQGGDIGTWGVYGVFIMTFIGLSAVYWWFEKRRK